jgi:hydroxymethylpyrimidine pyrophosphatase-like HAD family hydrolase
MTIFNYVDSLENYSRSYMASKILLIDENERLEPIRRQLASKYMDSVNIFYSKPTFLEIFNIDVSKIKGRGDKGCPSANSY